MSDDKKATKQFSLKPIELQMCNVLQSQYFTTLSNFLSFLALERLAYPVTEHTKFKIEGDTIFITEEEPPKPEAVSTGTETTPLKGDK